MRSFGSSSRTPVARRLTLAGYQIASSSGASATLSAATIAPGGLLVIDAAQLGFTPAAGDRLFLVRAGGQEFEDAQEVTNRLRGRANGWNRSWLFPSAPFVWRCKHVQLQQQHRDQRVDV